MRKRARTRRLQSLTTLGGRRLGVPASVLLLILCGCHSGYDRRGDELVFVTWDEGQGRRAHPIEGADARSFRALNRHFATDGSTAYFEWKRIEGANANAFVPLSELYARDGERVFYMEQVVANADPNSFELIGVDWGRDRRDVYLQGAAIGACDPATFAFLDNDWQRDCGCAYNRGRKLPDADPATFTVVNFWFAKDQGRVFHSGSAGVIDGADPASFQVRGECTVCGKDKDRCYRFDEVVACDAVP